ncbi:F-box/FBD/LRR-repeat protein [Trifolium repens]|nr:F-box/FBD/LRR-repeat protein [Trifolium repens]
MSLLNKKANQDDHIDQISDLPCNVIDGILEKLNIRELVRTSILSTKWRYKWTYVPKLVFGMNFFELYEDLYDPEPVVSKIITDVLMLHNGPIYKFCLFIPVGFNFKTTAEHFDIWVPLLSKGGIKKLVLDDVETLSHLPYIVFSYSVAFESGALENLISGCPLLEKLRIQYYSNDCFEYLDFSAPTLKVLFLEFGCNVKSICLKKANNLIDLTLMCDDDWVSGLIKSLPKNIQRFSIRAYDHSKIPDIIPPTLVKSSFNSIKYLKLDGVKLNERGELLYIISVLKSAPRLVELVIQSNSHVDITQAPDRLEELERSSCCLNQLQMVNICIRATSHEHAMSLIRFILANATLLKLLTFKFSPGTPKLDAPVLLSISQDLLLMKRVSQSAQVKFIH